MPSTIAPDALLSVVLWTSLTIAVAAISTTVRAAAIRLRQTLQTKHEVRFVARWRPLLLETVDAVPTHLPRVKKPDWVVFLTLWNQFLESVKGPARHRLKAVALRQRMDSIARNMLVARDDDNRVIAVATLGHLGDHDSWDALEEIARSRKPLLSVVALKALFSLDSSRAAAVLLSTLGGRDDWPTAQLMSILAEAESSTISEGLVQAAEIAIPSELPRLIALSDAAHGVAVTPLLSKLLQTSQDEETLVACLKSRHLPKDLKLLAPLATSGSWQVRTQVARALENVISRGDEQLLISLMSDDVWWVRYRAAQSLARLPFFSHDELWRLRFVLTDRFAQDILDQVVAEETFK